ncbi:hypothetical protein EHO57_14185 [Leptospira langatensis]|uniref:Uncharacterized protein n=1 Tax=Leptospira langatensis TaxID=2484983 RepID=A0A5R2AT62_9LEPT|nr:hypothetical protein [Leptospira langatensis]TGJ99903.1 hypothetical protein EHO57_14185 [Leptospira langatensis]
MDPKKGSKDVCFSHDELVEIAFSWVQRRTSCGVVIKEVANTSAQEIPDVIGFGSGGHSFLIECKASRADFLKDKNKLFRQFPENGMGSQRFYLCPENIIGVEDLPVNWGLIWVNEQGKAKLKYSPYKGNGSERTSLHPKNWKAEHGLLYSCLRRVFLNGYLDCIYPFQEKKE